jgi:glycosyltransferase involved in cell wall biosynthesis
MLRLCYIGRYDTGEIFRGPEKVARRIADEMALLGHHVYFYEYFFSGISYGYMTKLFGYDTIENSAGLSIFRVGIFPFIFAMLRQRFDVIHIITFERFAILALCLKPFLRAPIVYSTHGIVKHEHANFRSNVNRRFKIKSNISEYLFYKFSDLLFFLSDRSVSIASQYYRIPKEKVVIVANGIDRIFYEMKKRKKRGRADVAVVFVGESKRPEKGLDFFLSVLERCARRMEVFVICENLPLAPVNTINGVNIHYIRKMETQKYVTFLSDKDIFVSASSYDQFSIAAVEAMSAGLVPIVTKETGMSRYVKNGVNGFVIEFGDVKRLAESLDLLTTDRKLREKLASNAQSTVSLHSWRSIAEEYLSGYGVAR